MPQRPFSALLIGINHYASPLVPDLAGCVADVTAVSSFLRTHYGVAADDITLLTDEAATYKTIQAAFQTRLLAPLQAWAKSTHARENPAAQPALLIYYSGHGSQAPAVNKPSGLDETLVPHDSRTEGVYDIKDWELGQWLAQLTHYTANVTVILDCCHSGSGTRGDKKQVTNERGCPADVRPQPTPTGGVTTVMRGAVDLSRQRQALDYVLLAACRNDQKAREEILGAEHPQRHGILTYWLLDVLRSMSPHQPLTYRELYEQVRFRVNSAHPDQMPQCEGDRDRLFLGDLRPVQGRWLSILNEHDGLLWVDNGAVQGLSVGSVLHVYPPGTPLDQETSLPPLATLEVTTVNATQSGCRRLAVTATEPIPAGARAVVHRYGEAPKRTKLALDLPEDGFMKTVRERLFREDIRPQIELALPSERAALRLVKVGDTLQLQDGSGQQIYQRYNLRDLNRYRRPFQPADLDPVVRDLLHLLRQTQVRNVTPEVQSEIAQALTVQLARLHVAAELQATPFVPDASGALVIPTGEPFVLSITHRYHVPLYFTVLELGYKGDVNQLYPQHTGENVAVAKDKVLTIGQSATVAEQFVMKLPAGTQSVEETIKVIATTAEANFGYLLQGELPAPPQAAPVMRGGPFRHLTAKPAPATPTAVPADQWGAVEMRVKVVSGTVS